MFKIRIICLVKYVDVSSHGWENCKLFVSGISVVCFRNLRQISFPLHLHWRQYKWTKTNWHISWDPAHLCLQECFEVLSCQDLLGFPAVCFPCCTLMLGLSFWRDGFVVVFLFLPLLFWRYIVISKYLIVFLIIYFKIFIELDILYWLRYSLFLPLIF